MVAVSPSSKTPGVTLRIELGRVGGCRDDPRSNSGVDMTTGCLYRELRIWKRISDGEIAVYICMERMKDQHVCVQSVEFFSKSQSAADWARITANVGDLFLDQDLD